MQKPMKVIYLNQEEFKVDVKPFLPYLRRLEGLIDAKKGNLNVVFVNDVYIRALNKAYRDKDKPTDVLSFNYEDGDLVGEVYVSVETARRQAVDHKHSLSDELIKLIVHGVLHIHGHDHEDDEDYKAMYKVEKTVLGGIAGDMVL